MNIKSLQSYLWILLFLVMSCTKLEIDKSAPKCIEKKIKEFNKSTGCNTAKVEEYTFQGITVYLFDPGNCGADLQAQVYNADCKNIGYLGGFEGSVKINGEDFSNATLVKTVWQK
jgi:hypothetical protein